MIICKKNRKKIINKIHKKLTKKDRDLGIALEDAYFRAL